ncbi:MAG: septum formation protein Maf [Candidatus Dadabacteria bacterium]|nr:MAG: septum formation protein Maf [Candidatus Dadabacteria bacterium]
MFKLKNDITLALASSSPRRRELLKESGFEFKVVPADVDETLLPAESGRAAAERLALLKAGAVSEKHPQSVVIGADTIVDLNGEIFDKPKDAGEAAVMLKKLSGRTHTVWTGIALCSAGLNICETAVSASRVTFMKLSSSAIERYAESGEPLGKAGGYAIQGQARNFVKKLDGSLTGVIGLDMPLLIELLDGAGLLQHD